MLCHETHCIRVEISGVDRIAKAHKVLQYPKNPTECLNDVTLLPLLKPDTCTEYNSLIKNDFVD